MSKFKSLRFLLTILILTSILAATISLVHADKGSSKGRDVWWYKNTGSGEGVWKAIIYETKSGIIHEWRYEWRGEPIDVHLIYKPVAKFPNQPQGKNWIPWTFDDRYDDLPGDEADLTDYFTRYAMYWVHFNHAVY